MNLPDQNITPPNVEAILGRLAAGVVQPGRMLGGWTGLPGSIDNVVGGTIAGAGSGFLFSGLQGGSDYLRGGRFKIRKRPVIAGALLGTLLGTLSGAALERDSGLYKQHAAYDPSRDVGRLALVIVQDPHLSQLQKQNALAQLRSMTPAALQQLMGTVAGAAVSGVLLLRILSQMNGSMSGWTFLH